MINENEKKTVLVTGAAGFIGFFLTKRLLNEEYNVIGIDNLNSYYDINLKKDRLKKLENYEKFTFLKMDIENKDNLLTLFKKYKPEIVINLAAQAGVRYSITNPDTYIKSNIEGFYNVLECCRKYPVEHLIYASSSSVYGNNKKVPFEETDQVDNPASLYAVTKKTNELMASSYSHLYKIPSTGLRFFTVYGPMGRPDMAYFKFTDKYFNNEAIQIYNDGDFKNDLYRDFTYIDDIVEGIMSLMFLPPLPNEQSAAHQVFNIGNSKPVNLMDYIHALEVALSNSLSKHVEIKKEYEPIKPGDVPATFASTKKLEKLTGYSPSTSIIDGLQSFTDWYVEYYKKINDNF